MDPDVLRRKAVEKGLIDALQAARLTEIECYELVFRPGFSTAATVSDISGGGSARGGAAHRAPAAGLPGA
jgi:two-component system chemotaxis sensor kinase CheA